MAMAAINLSFALRGPPVFSAPLLSIHFRPPSRHNIYRPFTAPERSPSFDGLYVSDSALSVLEESRSPRRPKQAHKRRRTRTELREAAGTEFRTTQWSFGIDIVHPSIRPSLRPNIITRREAPRPRRDGGEEEEEDGRRERMRQDKFSWITRFKSNV